MKKDDIHNAYGDVDYEAQLLKIKERDVKSKRAVNLLYFMLFILPFIIAALIAFFAHVEFDLSAKMWWAGFIAFLAGMILYLSYGSTFRIVRHASAALFAWGLFFFYIAIWLMPEDPAFELRKTIGLMVITVIVVIILFLLLYLKLKEPRKKKAVKIVMKRTN